MVKLEKFNVLQKLVEIKKEEKKEEKKEVKKETVDYSKMTVAELKEVASKKKISVTGMKKAEIIAALEK